MMSLGGEAFEKKVAAVVAAAVVAVAIIFQLNTNGPKIHFSVVDEIRFRVVFLRLLLLLLLLCCCFLFFIDIFVAVVQFFLRLLR